VHRYLPFLSWWPQVNSNSLRSDFIAGITNAVVVLPQGVAFSIIAGLPPVYGLYTAIVTPIIAALFGSSLHLISGPTTAISIVIFSSLSPVAVPSSAEFIELALLLTLMAGTVQLLMGIARLGTLVNFVSHSVIVGFTAGAAILIGFRQMPHVLGVSFDKSSQTFEGMFQMIQNIQDLHPMSVTIALMTMVAALAVRKLSPLMPHLLIGMLVGSFFSFIVGPDTGVTLIGEISNELPPFAIPSFSFDNMKLLLPKAFAIAMLGLIEAVAIGKSIALKSGQVINGNQEFIGQGLSNMVGSFFSCFMGTGSFGRSGINFESGARTPLSAIFAATTLMLIVLLIAPLAAYLSMPAVGAIILLVAYKLIDTKQAKKIFKASWQESAVLAVTFLSTLLFPLEYAIYLGVLFSLFFYLSRTSHPLIITVAPDPDHIRRKFTNIKRIKLSECPQLKIIRIDGSLFYGSVDHVTAYLRSLNDAGVRNVLLVLSGANIIDTAGAEMLVGESKRWRKMGAFLSEQH